MSIPFVFSIIAMIILGTALALLALVETHKQKESAALVASVAIMSLFVLCAWLTGDEMNWGGVQSLAYIALPGISITTAAGKHMNLVHASLCLAAAGLVMVLLTFNLLGTPWSIVAGAAAFFFLLAATKMADSADGTAHVDSFSESA